jgi:hypothetical protein
MKTHDAPERAVSGEAYRVLLQTAMLGTEMAESALAIEIAEALAALRPDLPHACIVLAMSEFCAGRKDAGVHELETTLVRFPDSQLCKAMLAVCMQDTGRQGWQALLESVIEDGRDEYAMRMACTLLGRDDGSLMAAPGHSAPVHAMWV